MSLPLLVIIVVVGIAATVIAVHLTGGSAKAALMDAAQAQAVFAADHPEVAIGGVQITANGDTAFIDLANGSTGIVHSFGVSFFTRIASAKDVATIRFREPATLSIRFKDFTWTGGHFHFADADAAKAILARLSA